MHIAFLVYEFPSPTQTFVVDAVETLLQRGVEVTVLVRPKHYTAQPPFPIHPVYDRIRWRDRTVYLGRDYLWSPFRKPFVAAARLLAAARRSPQATRTFVSRVWKRRSRMKDRMRALLLYLPFVGRNLDALHIHFSQTGEDILDIGELLDLPVIVSVYGADVSLAQGQRLGTNRRLFHNAERILPCSEHLKALVLQYGVDAGKVRTHPLQCDTEFFCPTIEAPEPQDEVPIILTVARLHWKKGLLDGAAALSLLKQRGVHFRWLVAGGGPDEAAVRAAISDFHLSEAELLGNCSRDKIREMMQKASVFFLPSVREEFGAVLAEAQACGLPIVATKVGGVPEVVEDGVSGFLVNSRDPQEMADRLQALLLFPEKGRRMGKEGRARVEKLFARRIWSPKLVRQYVEVIERRTAKEYDQTKEAANL